MGSKFSLKKTATGFDSCFIATTRISSNTTTSAPASACKNSFAVITDSGGISEETTVMGIPCFTMRNNTERPETQSIGTNTLVGVSIEKLQETYSSFIENGKRKSGIPELWDGKAAERIISILLEKL